MNAETALKEYAEFTDQQKRLVDLYTDPESDTYKNKVQSYIKAGYYVAEVPEGQEDDGRAMRSARGKAVKQFAKEHIWAAVEERLERNRKVVQMSLPDIVDEMSILAEADITDFLELNERCCPHCEGDISGLVQDYRFDIERMREAGYGAILKKMTPTKAGTVFEFHDKVQVMDRLMKHYGGYKSASSSTADALGAFDELILAARKR